MGSQNCGLEVRNVSNFYKAQLLVFFVQIYGGDRIKADDCSLPTESCQEQDFRMV